MRDPLPKTLILGIGNADRQDDGVAWHVLTALAVRLGRALPAEPGDEYIPGGQEPELRFVLQLTPEMAEELVDFSRVCFVDAQAGEIEADLSFTPIPAVLQPSPLTHHLTPQTLLHLAGALYGQQPQGWLMALRGHEFGFAHGLSAATAALVAPAVEKILAWLAAQEPADG